MAALGQPDRSPNAVLRDEFGKTYDLVAPRWCGDDGAPLTISDLPGIGRADIDQGERSLWRYRQAFALNYPSRISLGEGCTPLLARTIAGMDLYLKLEWFNPSGSFKDRGTALVASTLALQGIDRAITDSSGNGGSSLAAYCAAAGIDLKIAVPETTSASKVTQARAYGAEIQLVPGSRQESQNVATAQAGDRFYAGHNWHPFFLDGIKSIGYEIWEDLGFQMPDNIVVVSGGGSIALGCDVAFGELRRAGHIDRGPRLLIAQSRKCCPLFNAFHGIAEEETSSAGVSLAEGAAVLHPVRLSRVVDAVRRSGGTVVAVEELEIAKATLDLSSMGLFCEPTSAVAVAALCQLAEQSRIDPAETTVVILTGSGLKTADTIAGLISAHRGRKTAGELT